MIIYIVIYLGIFLSAYQGVRFFIRWSEQRNLLDIPNERSSHIKPTPRGGGIVIFAVSLISLLIYLIYFREKIIWSYTIGSIIVAGVSWLDDLWTVSPIWRFLCHSLAAFLVIWDLGGFTDFYIPFWGFIKIGLWGNLITFFWIIWLINAYNFMDGIDGIAAVQAITAGIAWCVVGFYIGSDVVGFYGGVLATVSLGFLIHNWSPAKVFLGDVGSAFLGFSFAVLPLFWQGKSNFSQYLPWFGLLFVWFFIFDSILTLFKRLIEREKFWQAHRQHIYQKLVVSGFSHISVTLIYGSLSLLLILTTLFILKVSDRYSEFILLVVLLESVSLIILLEIKKLKK